MLVGEYKRFGACLYAIATLGTHFAKCTLKTCWAQVFLISTIERHASKFCLTSAAYEASCVPVGVFMDQVLVSSSNWVTTAMALLSNFFCEAFCAVDMIIMVDIWLVFVTNSQWLVTVKAAEVFLVPLVPLCYCEVVTENQLEDKHESGDILTQS